MALTDDPQRVDEVQADELCRDCGEFFTPYTVEVPPTMEVVLADRCRRCVAA